MVLPIQNNSCKHEQVYEILLREFSSGSCKIGEKLPSERDVASRLQVNIRTVRRAYRDLILGGIVEKRIGSGTYLKILPGTAWEKRPVNVVIGHDYGSQGRQMISRLLPSAAGKYNRPFRIISAMDNDLDKIIRSCISLKQGTILCLSSLDGAEAVFEDPELFVAVSSGSHTRGIPCVLCDDTLGISGLMEHLDSIGRRRIAILEQEESIGDGLGTLQYTAWKKLCGSKFDPALRFILNRDSNGAYIRRTYELVAEKLKKIAFDALICTTDDFMYGAMAAIRQAGLRIPEDVAVVSIGNSPLAEFANPPVTSCDPDMAAHLDAAFELLDHNHKNPEKIETLRLIQPKIFIRQSTTN